MSDILEKLNNQGTDKTRFFYDEEPIGVHAPDMGRKEYSRMEADMKNYNIEKEKYSLYAWNDVSGFDYWNEEGHCGYTNYIMIEISIEDVTSLNDEDLEQLEQDIDKFHSHFYQYHNID